MGEGFGRVQFGVVDGAHSYLNDVLKSSQRATDLCKQLLANSGKGKFVVQPFSLGEPHPPRLCVSCFFPRKGFIFRFLLLGCHGRRTAIDILPHSF